MEDCTGLHTIPGAPDTIQDAGVSRNGTPLLRVIKDIDGKRHSAVFAVRRKRRKLALQNM